MAQRLRLILIATLTAVLAPWVSTSANDASQLEYKVKAAFVYNFTKFVEWPSANSSPNKPFVIAVLGDDPFGPMLEEMVSGRDVNGRKVEIKRFDRLSDLTDCHILFISSSESNRLGRIIEQLKGKSVLTVGDDEKWPELGLMINFVVVDGKVQFEVNLKAAQQSGLKISSKLLKLAKIVES